MLVVALMLASAAGGCEVTPEKIAAWRESENGPPRLRATLEDSRVSDDLRAQAAVALVQVGMLAEVQQDIAAQAADVRVATLAALVPKLWRLAEGGGPAGQAPTMDQVKAKDELYLLRDQATPDERRIIDTDLAAWICADLTVRAEAGGYGSAEILVAIGSPAADALVGVLERPGRGRPTSTTDTMLAANLLGRIGDDGARDRGARPIISALESATPGTSPGEEASLLKALGSIGGPAATQYLERLATVGRPGADDNQGLDLRLAALDALRQRAEPGALGAALDLAGDLQQPAAVRDSAFALVQKIGGPGAMHGVLALVDDRSDAFRWEAIDTALGAATVETLPQVLEALPKDRAYSRRDLEDFIYRPVVSRFGDGARGVLRHEIESPSWIARLIAVDLLGEIGGEEDAALVASLANDRSRLRGWDPNVTLGDEAVSMAQRLAQRQ